jgi:hypothetical protein
MYLIPLVPARMKLSGLALAAALFIATGSAGAQSQAVTQEFAAPAHIALVDGAAAIDRDGESFDAVANAPLVQGDRLRTDAGRAEVLFPDGAALDLDEYSSVELDSPVVMRLTAGRLVLLVPGAGNARAAARYQIDTPAASTITEGAGEYRIQAWSDRDNVETELAVVRGDAQISTLGASVLVRAGERSVARNDGSLSYPETFNTARFDAFDQWVADNHAPRRAALSSQYLPTDLRTYAGTFDQYGSWQYAAPYGYVWYPTVAPTWRPYYVGYWSPVPVYGWTWIDANVWGWPTHHYGRWGFSSGAWFWIPGARWAPAWVSWALSGDYVSWCPLGFDNRAVFSLSVALGGGWNRWSGWSVVPRRGFESFGYYVNRHAIDPGRLPRSIAFVEQRTSPVPLPARASAGRQPSGQPVFASRQSPTQARQWQDASRQMPAASAQPRPPSRQSAAAARQSPAGARQAQPGNRDSRPTVRLSDAGGHQIQTPGGQSSDTRGFATSRSASPASARPSINRAVSATGQANGVSRPPSAGVRSSAPQSYDSRSGGTAGTGQFSPRGRAVSPAPVAPRGYANEAPPAASRTAEAPRMASPSTNARPRSEAAPQTTPVPRSYAPQRVAPAPRNDAAPRSTAAPRSEAPRGRDSSSAAARSAPSGNSGGGPGSNGGHRGR